MDGATYPAALTRAAAAFAAVLTLAITVAGVSSPCSPDPTHCSRADSEIQVKWRPPLLKAVARGSATWPRAGRAWRMAGVCLAVTAGR
jgi:hypothetical protein